MNIEPVDNILHPAIVQFIIVLRVENLKSSIFTSSGYAVDGQVCFPMFFKN